MVSTTFNFTGATRQETAVLTATSGDFIRIRFQKKEGPYAILSITNNGVETFENIVAKKSWVSGALMTGDLIKLIIPDGYDGTVYQGIIEVGQ